MTSRLGSAINFTGAAANVTFPQNLIATSGTIGVFFEAPSWAGTQVIVHTSGASSVDGIILFGNAGTLTVQSAGSNASTGIALTANTPYFVAMSFTFTGVPLNELVYLVLVNLATGTATVNSGLAINTPNTIGGTGPVIGNFAPKNLSILGKIGPVAFTNGFTPLAGLRRWAEDPWSFWYPRIGINTHFYGQVSSGISGALAVTEAPDVAAFAGSFSIPSVSGVLATVEIADLVAIAGAIQLVPAGILAASDPADLAQISMIFTAPPPETGVPYPAIVDYGWKRRQPPVPKIKGRRG
jgi:hypothetical protein